MQEIVESLNTMGILKNVVIFIVLAGTIIFTAVRMYFYIRQGQGK